MTLIYKKGIGDNVYEKENSRNDIYRDIVS